MRLSFSNLRRRLPVFLAGAAVCAWILFVSCSYLRDCSPALPLILLFNLRQWFVQTGTYDLLLVVWIWGVAAGTGTILLKRFGLQGENQPEKLALSSAVGLSVLSLTVMAVGGLKVLYPWVGYAILIVTSLCVWSQWQSAIRDCILEQRPRSTGDARVGRGLLWTLIVSGLLLILVSALAPEIDWDPLVVHLFAAKTYVQGHGLRPIPDIPQTFFPKHVTMLFTFGMLLHNEITAKLIHYLLGLLTLIAAYGFGWRLISRDAGLLSVGILVSSPLFVWEMRTAHTELGLTLYVFLSLMTALVWLRSKKRSWLVASVYFLAFSQGTKYHALFALGALSCVVAVAHWYEEKNVRVAIYSGGRIAAFGLLGLLPWMIGNAIHARNPFFPFLNGVFTSPYWDASLTRIGLHEMADSGVALQNLWELFTLGLQMGVNENGRFHGNVGPLYLILIPMLIFCGRSRPEVWLILGFSFLYGLIWLLTGQHARYLLPLLPGLALVSALALVCWISWCRNNGPRWLARGSAILFFLGACLASPLLEPLNGGAQYGSRIWQSLPWSLLSGQETREAYITRQVPSFPLVQLLNQQPGLKRVLFWWNTTPAAFYAAADAGFNFSPYFPKLLSDQEQQLVSTLAKYRVTHILVAQAGQEAYLLTDPERSFVQKHLRLLGQKNAHVLFEFSAEALQQGRMTYDFLSHILEAKINMPGPPKGNEYYRQTGDINGDQRQILLMFPPAVARFQNVSIQPASTMRFAVGLVSQPSCSAPNRFEVWITPQRGESRRLFDREVNIKSNLEDRNWLEAEINLEPFAGQPVDILFKSFQTGSQGCDWIAWSDPRIVAQPTSPPRSE